MSEEISIDLLVPNDYNPRKHFDDAQMKELEKSIKNQGLVQAITVRPVDGGKYEVVAGIRRYLAAKSAGLKSIPVMVKKLSDEEAKIASLTENLERANLTFIEEARAFANILGWEEQYSFEDGRQEGLRQLVDELASKIQVSDTTIYHRLSLLHLPESLQIRVEQETLGIKVAEVIVRLKELWEIRTANITKEEIDEERSTIKTEIQEIMEEIASTIQNEDEARKRVNDYIETEKMNTEQRKKQSDKQKIAFENAEKDLIEFLTQFEIPSNWNEINTNEKSEYIKSQIKTNIDKLSGKKLSEISKLRALRTNQLDKYLANLVYVKKLVLDVCPHCGAGIKTSSLEKKIEELKDEINILSKDENEAGDELNNWRKKEKRYEVLSREYASKQKIYQDSLKEA